MPDTVARSAFDLHLSPLKLPSRSNSLIVRDGGCRSISREIVLPFPLDEVASRQGSGSAQSATGIGGGAAETVRWRDFGDLQSRCDFLSSRSWFNRRRVCSK